MNNISNIVSTLLIKNDYAFANQLCRTFYGKSLLKVMEIPKVAKVWFICCQSDSKTEQLLILHKFVSDLKKIYKWIPRLEIAEYINLRAVGKVYALPISASLIKQNPEFITHLSNSHNLLRLIKRRK